MPDPSRCVILVPYLTHIALVCEDGLRELERRGHPVWRVRADPAADSPRSVLAADALARGFDELMWVDPDVGFDPGDVALLRDRGLPVAVGLVPAPGRRAFRCEFLPGTDGVTFGPGGSPLEVRYAGLGFALVRREVFDVTARRLDLPVCDKHLGRPFRPWFLPMVVQDPGGPRYLPDDYAFCERARQCGFRVTADPTVRVWVHGAYRFSWEDAGGEVGRFATYEFRIAAPPAAVTADASGMTVSPPPVVPAASVPASPRETSPAPRPALRLAAQPPAVTVDTNGTALSPPSPAVPTPAAPRVRSAAPRPALRGPAAPLPPGFPRLKAYAVTYPANMASMDLTRESFRSSDWGDDLNVFVQPADWPVGKPSAARNYKRMLEDAAADGCDFTLVLEDDARVGRHLRHNLTTLPLVRRDQCDYLSLYVPDLIMSPWKRQEPHLGYRLAKPLYSGPNKQWEKHRLWGSQGLLLSRRFVLAALDRWDGLTKGLDTRVITVCSQFKLPMWYSAPCLVDHAPVRSAHGTPTAHAPDFDPDFRLEVGPGFQPPEEVPGWLTVEEGRLLWQTGAGRAVLELGTASGRSTVCLAQSARSVVSADVGDQSEAAEWVRRYGTAGRVEFRQVVADAPPDRPGERFDLVLVDTEHHAAAVARDIATGLRVLTPGGLLAFHDYPDPGWPDVRRVVDDHARRLGWKRVAQAGYLGVFQT